MRSLEAVSIIIVETLILLLVGTQNAAAYIDPGTTGVLSQVLYVLFYGAVGVVLYGLRYLKGSIGNMKAFLSRRFWTKRK
jgi:hypothetical protein